MRAERVFYECSPYLHSVVGIATIVYPGSSLLMKVFGLLLLAAAATILGLRWVYRFDLAREIERGSDQKKYVTRITQELFHDASAGHAPGRSLHD